MHMDSIRQSQSQSTSRRMRLRKRRMKQLQILLIVISAICIGMVIYIIGNHYTTSKTISHYQSLILRYEKDRGNYEKQYVSIINELENEVAYNERNPIDDVAVINKVTPYKYVLENGLSSNIILYADEQCKKWDLNPHLLWAIVETESQYNPNVNNASGSTARGLGQIVINTARHLYENVLGNGMGTYFHDMAYDPYINIQMMCALIGTGLQDGNSLEFAINRYSGGTSGYLEHVLSVADSHGHRINDDTCRYPHGS